MKEGKIIHWFLKNKLISKSLGILLLISAINIVLVGFAFTKGFAVSSLIFKEIVTYSISVFSFDNSPIKNDSGGQSVATSVGDPTILKGSVCASKVFKSSSITAKGPKLKMIDSLIPELSQRLSSFFPFSNQQTSSNILSIPPSKRKDKGVQSSLHGLEEFSNPSSVANNLDDSVSGNNNPTLDGVVSDFSQRKSKGEDSAGDFLLASQSENTIPLRTVDTTSETQTSVAQTLPNLQPAQSDTLFQQSQQQLQSIAVHGQTPAVVQAFTQSPPRLFVAPQLAPTSAQQVPVIVQPQAIPVMQNSIQQSVVIQTTPALIPLSQASLVMANPQQVFSVASTVPVPPPLPTLPVRGSLLQISQGMFQQRMVQLQRDLDQQLEQATQTEKQQQQLEETSRLTAEVERLSQTNPIKVFRVPGNSMAAEYLREGINPETFQLLTGNEKIEYIDDLEISSGFLALLAEEVNKASSLQENLESSLQESFDTSLIKKLISFYKYVLSAYGVWEVLENQKLHDVAKSVRNENLELKKINSQCEEFEEESEVKEKVLKDNMRRASSALTNNKIKRMEKVEMIKSTVLKMPVPYKKWIIILNKQIEKISKENEALEQQIENNDNSVWDLRSLNNEKIKWMDNLEGRIKKRQVILEMERNKAEETYNKSYSSMQKLIECCIKEGMENNRINGNNEEIEEISKKFVIIFENDSDERVNQILSNIEESMPKESWETVNKELIFQIDTFRKVSRVMKEGNSSIKEDAELQELQKKLGIAKTQLEEIVEEIGEISGKIYELDEELIKVHETLENVKRNHDAFEKWVISLESVDEDAILGSIVSAKEGLSRMKENLQSHGRDVTEFEEALKDLQKLGKSLEEKIRMTPQLYQRYEAYKIEYNALREEVLETQAKHDAKKKKHQLIRKKFVEIKEAKELMLKEALEIFQELSMDILQLEDYTVIPTHATEYAEFTQKFLCKFTPQGHFAVLSPFWQEFEATFEETMRQERPVLNFEKLLPQKGNRIPLRDSISRDELTESF